MTSLPSPSQQPVTGVSAGSFLCDPCWPRPVNRRQGSDGRPCRPTGSAWPSLLGPLFASTVEPAAGAVGWRCRAAGWAAMSRVIATITPLARLAIALHLRRRLSPTKVSSPGPAVRGRPKEASLQVRPMRQRRTECHLTGFVPKSRNQSRQQSAAALTSNADRTLRPGADSWWENRPDATSL